MTESYGPTEIAAARAKIAASRALIADVPDDDMADFPWRVILAIAEELGAALDALEAAQKNEQADGKCIEHWSGRAIEAEASAEVAEAEVERLQEENASLLRRIESLQMPARGGAATR